MTRFGNWLLLATGFAILAIVGTLTNPASKALAESDTFTTIDFPGASSTSAFGINPRGDIVGQYDDSAGVTHGFLLSGGEFTSIDFPGASSTDADGINPRGDIVGRYRDVGGTFHGFLLLNEGITYITFDPPGATETFAAGINDSGEIVGFYVDVGGTTHGFLATPEQEPTPTGVTGHDSRRKQS